MGDAHSPVQAHSFGRILDALHASDQDAFATIAEIMPSQKRSASFFCHSERSEESLLSSDANQHALPTVTQRSFAFAQDDKHEGGLYQTALAKIAEITARGTLHQVDGKLEQANFPRVVHALYDRAERFVFVFNLLPGAIDHRVD